MAEVVRKDGGETVYTVKLTQKEVNTLHYAMGKAPYGYELYQFLSRLSDGGARYKNE